MIQTWNKAAYNFRGWKRTHCLGLLGLGTESHPCRGSCCDEDVFSELKMELTVRRKVYNDVAGTAASLQAI